MAGSTKRIYDRILSSNTALSSKKLKDKQKTSPLSQKHGLKGSAERKDTPDDFSVYNQGSYLKSIPHQSIDDIKMFNNKIKLIKKNRTIEDMLISHTPTIHLKNYHTDKCANSKLYRKY